MLKFDFYLLELNKYLYGKDHEQMLFVHSIKYQSNNLNFYFENNIFTVNLRSVRIGEVFKSLSCSDLLLLLLLLLFIE